MALCVTSLVEIIDKIYSEFFDQNNKEKYDDYIGVEKLNEEFLNLSLPRASDILDIAAGPGLISALLQKQGYCSIDALDDGEQTIKDLSKHNLFRNLICKKISGLNSTGLKEDVYDAVVMVGGFRPDKIAPKDLNEILRITKPEGHVLWTMRVDYHNHDSDFGLIDGNLTALEKAGKCLIMKQGEKFSDPHSNMDGLFYMIKRIDKEDFQPTNLMEDAVPNIVMGAFQDKNNKQVLQEEVEVEWAADGDAALLENFNGHVKLVQAFFKLQLLRNVEILDVSSYMPQPGLVGTELSHLGYDHVDGLDHDLTNLNLARKAKLYRNYILGNVAELGSIPVNDECYDVILMGGGFESGKISPSAFPELVRVLRPGGYIMWTMRDPGSGSGGSQDPEFALFDVKVQDLVYERKCELLVGPVFFENFDAKSSGKFYMLKKCHREVFALGSPRHSPNSSPRLPRRRRRSSLRA